MITAVIVIVLGIAMIAAGGNGEWGSVAVGAVIIVFLIALHSAGVKTSRAYNNFVDYWAAGGTRKVKEKKRKVSVFADREPTEREKREAKERRERYAAEMRFMPKRESGKAVVCHYCGRFVRVHPERVATGEGMMLMYDCPKCGRKDLTKIGA